MEKIEIIVKEIDKTLIEKSKNYMTLGQANKLLFDSNLITEDEKKNQFLKKLLEDGKIKNAKKTEISPRQWRIFLSDKKLKKEIEKNEKSNVRKKSNHTETKKNKRQINNNSYDWKKIIIGIIILIVFFSVIVESNKDNYDSDPILAYNYAKGFIKENLKSPSTAKFPGTFEKKDHVRNLGNGEYLIESWVDSQNSFGAMVRSRWSCKIIMKNERVKVENLRIE